MERVLVIFTCKVQVIFGMVFLSEASLSPIS